MFEKLQELRRIKESYEVRLRDEGRGIIEGILKQFFACNPKITALRWKQFTPFFNDGDPCYFSVRSIDCQVAEEDAEKEIKYSSGDNWTEDGCYGLQDNSHIYEPLRKLESELHGSSDLLEAVFGDHVEVTATPEGIHTRDYDSHH